MLSDVYKSNKVKQKTNKAFCVGHIEYPVINKRQVSAMYYENMLCAQLE